MILCCFFNGSESVASVYFRFSADVKHWLLEVQTEEFKFVRVKTQIENCTGPLKFSPVKSPHTDSLMPSLKADLPLKIFSYKVDTHMFVSPSAGSLGSLHRSHGYMTGEQDSQSISQQTGQRRFFSEREAIFSPSEAENSRTQSKVQAGSAPPFSNATEMYFHFNFRWF